MHACMHVQYATNLPRNLQLPNVYVIHLYNIILEIKQLVLLTKTSLISVFSYTFSGRARRPGVVIRRLLQFGDVSLKRRLSKLLRVTPTRNAAGENNWRLAGFFGDPERCQRPLENIIHSSMDIIFRFASEVVSWEKDLQVWITAQAFRRPISLFLLTIGQLKFQTTKSWTSVDDLWWISWVKACNKKGIETHPSLPTPASSQSP